MPSGRWTPPRARPAQWHGEGRKRRQH
ncbi:unnamed protein product [Spirodela intermedia]|uniref:Uncharacterized protein n=1 Tax=Spirodela intermedia TaxID=51605 RepID=A0A7I8INQ6_SPIIN|nr:unnamed protein product [Spirodela intermedia]CAA6658617.1 unnamed protein product [Spirodela intermedia]